MLSSKSCSQERPSPGFFPTISGPSAYGAPRSQNCQPGQRCHNNNWGGARFPTILTVLSLLVLTLSLLSCLMVLYQNVQIIEQNLRIYEKQALLQAQLPRNDNDNYDWLNEDKDIRNVFESIRRVRRNANPPGTCPPCPTLPSPTPIYPHKNPVSVLNEEIGNKAIYALAHVCKNPPIHHANLTINDHSFLGKSWLGKGKSIQNAKQVAAWAAIQSDFHELIDEVGEEYKPPVYEVPHKPIHQIR